MRFLTGGPLQKAISAILQEQSFKCAVAFWGTGASPSYSQWRRV